MLVQTEHSTHLIDLTAATTGYTTVIVDHEVIEIFFKGFCLRQPEAQAQLKQALWMEVSQSKSLSHDIFKPPIGSLFLVGFRQIQIVLPDILQRERKAPKSRVGEGREKLLSLFESQKQFLCAD